MLSLEECRKYLPEEEFDMTDERLLELRDQLYGMAELALDDYFDSKKSKATHPPLHDESKFPVDAD